MKLKKRVVFLAVLLGLITVALLYNYITSIEEPPVPEIEMTQVITAINTIPENTRISAEMLTESMIPAEAVHPDVIKDAIEIIGFITKSEIITGEQVLRSRIAFDQLGTNLSYLIPENMRAITISIGEVSGVAGHVYPGDKIDLLVTYSEEEITENPTTFTQFQNIEVIRKGVNPHNNAELDSANQGLTSTITILVTPEQAEVIAFANLYGATHISLRNPIDGDIVNLDDFGFDNFDDWRAR